MQIDENNLMLDIYKLEKYLIRNEKFSSVDVLLDYYSLASLLEDILGIEVNTDIFMNNKKIDNILHKYYLKSLKAFVNFLNDNGLDLTNLSNNFNKLLPNDFESFVYLDSLSIIKKNKIFSQKEFEDIFYSFFSEFGNNTFKIVKEIIESKKIELGMDMPIENTDGYTVNSFLTNDYYIVSAFKRLSLENMIILAHEIGHAIDFHLVSNAQGKRNATRTSLIEVPSCFFELSFIDYLQKNHIDNYYSLNMLSDDFTKISSFNKYKDILIDEDNEFTVNLDGKINGDNLKENLKDNNIKDDLLYFLGYIVSLNAMLISRDNKKDYIKTLNNFICLKHEQSFKESIETLGTNYNEFISCNLINPYVKEKSYELINRNIKRYK